MSDDERNRDIAQRFHDIRGWLQAAEGLELMKLAFECGGNVVEIGSFAGRSTAFLAQGIKDRNEGRVYAVDTFLGSSEMLPGGQNPVLGIDGKQSIYPEFYNNMARFGFKDIVVPQIGKSLDIVETWNVPISVLFIDAEHDYDSVSADFAAWGALVQDAICFHDYCASWPGVIKFVDSMLRFFRVHYLVGDMMVCRF